MPVENAAVVLSDVQVELGSTSCTADVRALFLCLTFVFDALEKPQHKDIFLSLSLCLLWTSS